MGNNERVRVYRNLHRSGPDGEPVYSVQARRPDANGRLRWIVVDHATRVHLRDVEFRVSAAGRARVLRDRRKVVHAYVVGTRVFSGPATLPCKARYNPYATDSFIDRGTGAKLLTAQRARVDEAGVHYAA